jgi:hypothetical protein
MRVRGQRIWRAAPLVLLLALISGGGGVASARAGSAVKTVTYRGYSVSVPRSWPVFNLSRDPAACVRFNRHAVYLGVPGPDQHCPAHAAGRSEAILIEPIGASTARATSPGTASTLEGSVTSFRTATVKVIATWSRQRGLIARALRRTELPPPPRLGLHRALDARAARPGAHSAQAVYTGLGFDACSAPSPQAMTAWGSSPYRAIGIYIGGVNAACSQPNLSSTWVGNESAAGWHMIPTYVGLQAPTNSCGCAGIDPSQASAQGTAAAQDAVSAAQTLGLGPDTPIYDDMEGYGRGTTNSSAVLAYLSGWTTQLHADGYLSGVYSSANSGITDLVSQYGTSYPEPDDIWIADWNGQQTTDDPAVPSTDWQNHQRLHQYRGGHNETYGGVTINVDNNYLDGATATGGASTAQAPPPPTLTVSPAASGMTNLTTSWGGPGLLSWQVLAGIDPSTMGPIGSASANGPKTSIAVRSSAPYFAVQALGAGGQALATSPAVLAPPHVLLFGHSVFVGASGVAGLPAGCYLPVTCHLVTTVSLGRATLARTGTEAMPAGGTGILFFKLTASARRLLARARSARLPVKVTVTDVSGSSATSNVVLIPYSTRGRGATHSVSPSPLIQPVGFTDFVFARGAGGILVGCDAVYACPISARLTVGRTTLASTRPELVNGRELGYLLFFLTPQGRQLLVHATGNQLGASLVLTFGSAVARARITLVQFN